MSLEIKISITPKGNLLKGKAPEIIQKQLDSAMYSAVMLLEKEVKKRTPLGVLGAQGGLESTIHGEVMNKGTPFVKGIVATSSKYGEIIEKGRRAGKARPPEGRLIRWMQVKLGMDESTARKMEFVVRRKIGQKGFPGAHMFENALNENMDKIQNIFDKAGFDIARELGQ